jgi:hypothetical protein
LTKVGSQPSPTQRKGQKTPAKLFPDNSIHNRSTCNKRAKGRAIGIKARPPTLENEKKRIAINMTASSMPKQQGLTATKICLILYNTARSFTMGAEKHEKEQLSKEKASVSITYQKTSESEEHALMIPPRRIESFK